MAPRQTKNSSASQDEHTTTNPENPEVQPSGMLSRDNEGFYHTETSGTSMIDPVNTGYEENIESTQPYGEISDPSYVPQSVSMFGQVANEPVQSGTSVSFNIPPIQPTTSSEEKFTTRIPTDNVHYIGSVSGPIVYPLSGEKNYSQVQVNFMGCKSVTELNKLSGNVGRALGRVRFCIELGATYVRRKVDYSDSRPHLSRQEERTIFKPALDILEDLLTLVWKYDDGKRVGFGINTEIYKALCKELIDLKGQAFDDLVASGEGVVSLPLWGKDGMIANLWIENDFEVLGATYRAEVEKYLHTLAKHHKFQSSGSSKNIPEEKKSSANSSVQPETSKGTELTEPAIEEPSQHESESITAAFRSNSLNRTRTWNNNKPTSSFGHPMENSSGSRVRDLFTSRTTDSVSPHGSTSINTSRHTRQSTPGESQRSSEKRGAQDQRQGRQPDSGPPDGDDDDDNGKGSNKRGPERNPREPGNNSQKPNALAGTNVPEPQFDYKLKVDTIPTWDGNLDSLGRWILKINRLSERSTLIYKQLGMLVPTRLTEAAENWYYSQGAETRSRIEQDWGTLRDAFGAYFMNRAYMDRQKSRANRATYRDQENLKETPSEYFIRKLELLEMVYDYTEVELINEIMAGAPSYWISILTPHLYRRLDEFQLAIKFHEDNLNRMEPFRYRSPIYAREGVSRNPFNQYRNVRTNLIGWSKATSNPTFPKDDSVISKGKTPEDKGARPCRHCGSGKHWDSDCKYSRKGEKRARVNMVSITEEERLAQDEYDATYFEEISDNEDQDFQ